MCLSGSALSNLAKEFPRGDKERILLEDSPDDDHRMGPHDVDYGVSAKFREIVDADDCVIVVKPDIVHAGFKFHEIINIRSVFSGPVHVADDAAEGKVSLGIAAGQLLECLEHAFLIEAAVAQVRFSVGSKFKLTALLSSDRVDAHGSQSLEVVVMLIRVNDVDCLVAASESVPHKRKQDAIPFVGTVEESTDVPCLAKLRACKGDGCRSRLDCLCLLYGSPLTENTNLRDERLLYFGIAWRCVSAPV